jgi:hypothetical protein
MWCWNGGRSASAGGQNAGSRCTSSSQTGHSNCQATHTPARSRTVSLTGARSSASSRTMRRALVHRCGSTPRSPSCARMTGDSCCRCRKGQSAPVASLWRRGRSASTHPAVVRGRGAEGAADCLDALPAAGGPAGRRRARCWQRRLRLPDRRRTVVCGAHRVPVSLQAPARPAAVPRQGRLLVAGPDGPLRPDDRQVPRSAQAAVTGVSGGYDVNVRQMAADV